ncbi:MAG TPA: hypothetical protein PKD09_01345 [Aggregatilinea sp.]|nr:hypothetical protein [Aggregatilinea sp.]HML20259.1 hypothetical protein [Aggregatilinea sp.]
MSVLARWFIKAGLVYFVLALVAGVWLAASASSPLPLLLPDISGHV